MKTRSAVAAASLVLLSHSPLAAAAEVQVLSAGGIRPPLEELVPQFERVSGHKVAIKYVGGPAIKRELDAGLAYDLVIAPAEVMDDLVKANRIAAATRADVARAGVGVGVRAGAPRPDIASVDAFKRALLNARSVAYAKDGAAGVHFVGVLERLGISQEMAPKLKPTVAGDPMKGTMALVAKGEAEIGVAAIATVVAPGVDLVGPLPAELQTYIYFVAGVRSGAKEGQAAAALIGALTAPHAAPVFRAKGMEPAPQR